MLRSSKFISWWALRLLGAVAIVFAIAYAAFDSSVFAEKEGETRMSGKSETITLGGGCFWCIEAVFQGFKGVQKVQSGYAGGKAETATYEEVSSGDSGHAEVVQLAFDPGVISLRQILTIFFHAHDPTTKDRQGNDIGSQYRSVIFYSDEAQRNLAQEVKEEISNSGLWSGKEIVTEISPLTEFHKAEDYHQNYYQNNPNKPYCAIVIGPKLAKIRKEFSALLRN